MFENRKQLNADELAACFKVKSLLEHNGNGNNFYASILGLYDNVADSPSQLPNRSMSAYENEAACTATMLEGLYAGYALMEKRVRVDLDYHDKSGDKKSLGVNQEEARTTLGNALHTMETVLQRDYPTEYQQARTRQNSNRSAAGW